MSEQPALGDPQWTLGDRLGKALDSAGIRVGEMAEYLECSPNTVSNYTNDRTKVPGSVVRLWAMKTGVRLEWLKSGETTPTPPDDDTKSELERLAESKRGRTRGTRGGEPTARYSTAA